jgi:ribonucleoside-triphosphate reductase (thioredoxin)
MSDTMFKSAASEFVYYRTYSRWLDNKGRRENWPETVQRYIDFIKDKFGDVVPDKVLRKIQEKLMAFEVMPSMRFLWAAGGPAKADNATIYNCSFATIDNILAFSEALYILMCGCGYGFSVENKYTSQLPVVPEQILLSERIHIVEDSKNGWADSVKDLIGSLYSGQDIKIDYNNVRPAGSRLKTMGGRASGPGPLAQLHSFIREVLYQARGRKLTSIECHDILNEIATIVVVGGVRRSSEISLSDLDDELMRNSKSGNFPIRRYMANNSAVYHKKPDIVTFMKEWASLIASKSGERGIFNLEAAKRMAPKRRNAELIVGTNPCAEIQLRSNEFCNLSEVVASEDDGIDTMLEKIETAVWMGVIQACFTDFPYLGDRWKKNCDEERLLGVSITGQMDAPHLFTEEALKAYKAKAIKIAKKASDVMGIPMPAAITCVKPSGCQTADTMVVTSDGIFSLEELGDIHGPNWQEHDINVAQEEGLEKSTKFFVNGRSLVKKINMYSGVSLISTLNHQYRVLENGDYIWKTSKDIGVGSIVPYRVGGYTGGNYQKLISTECPYHNCTAIKQPQELDENFAFLLGLYVGDGSNHKKGIRIAGDVNKQDSLLRAKKIALDLFGIEGIIYERTKGQNADLYLNSTHLLSFLSANNLLKPDTYNVDVPLIIRKSPVSVVESFIEGYIEADGCYTDRGIVICTTSEKMAKNLPIVLRAISKNCSMRLMPPTDSSWGKKMRYRITITKGREGNYLMDRKNKSYYEQLDKLNLNTLIPDKVVSVEYFEADTYDIEVPKTNAFIANSYVSHNTVSQLVNSSSGLHRRMFKYQIRRYRISASDPLFKLIRDQGLPVSPENGQRKQDYVKAQRLYDSIENKTEAMNLAKNICQTFDNEGWTADKVNTWVVSFPMAAPKNAMTVEDCSAMEQLEWYKKIQKNWCEHNASITVYVKPDEWLSVGDWVYKNWDIVNGISFLPEEDHIYEQAPNEKITKEEYDKMIKSFPKIDYSQLAKYEQEDNTEGAKSLACASGSCDI